MSADAVSDANGHRFHFDRHTPEYRERFRCPLAWTDTYGGHWVAAGHEEVFDLARCPHVSNDHDVQGERRGYTGINIPEVSATPRSAAACSRWTIPSTAPTALRSTPTCRRPPSRAGCPSSTKS